MKNDWLLSAAEDVLDAACLLRNKRYKNSLFLLEQSVEKASKGFLEKMDLLGNKYQSGVVLWGTNVRLPSPEAKGVEWHAELGAFLKDFLDALEKRAGSYSPDAERIKKLIEEFRKINSRFDRKKTDDLPIFVKILYAIQYLYNDLLLFSGDREALKKVKSMNDNRYSYLLFFVEPDVQRYISFLKVFILYALSSYLSPYESLSREPSFKLNRKRIIVKQLGNMISIVYDCIDH